MRSTKTVLSIVAALAAVTAVAAHPANAQETSPAFTWTGSYIGLHAGAVLDGTTRFDRTTGSSPNNTAALQAGVRPTRYKLDDDGFIGGVQVGYNNQLEFGGWPGGIVAGVEADISYTDIGSVETSTNTTFIGPLVTPSATPVTRVNEYQGQLKYLGTIRARLGVAYDQWLFYGTAGLAYGDVDRSVTFYGPNTPTTPFFTGTDNGVKTGAVYGGGVEYALPTGMLNFLQSSAVTIRAEYIHYDLGKDTLTFPGVNGGATLGSYTARVRTYGDFARAGINFKF